MKVLGIFSEHFFHMSVLHLYIICIVNTHYITILSLNNYCYFFNSFNICIKYCEKVRTSSYLWEDIVLAKQIRLDICVSL